MVFGNNNMKTGYKIPLAIVKMLHLNRAEQSLEVCLASKACTYFNSTAWEEDGLG